MCGQKIVFLSLVLVNHLAGSQREFMQLVQHHSPIRPFRSKAVLYDHLRVYTGELQMTPTNTALAVFLFCLLDSTTVLTPAEKALWLAAHAEQLPVPFRER